MKGKAKAKEFEGEGYAVHVVGRHVMVTEAMKSYAIKKLAKIEKFTNARIIDVTVTMDIQKLEHRADVIVKVDHTTITAHAATTDMYVSIDQAIEKIEKQLRRYKKKIRNHHAKDLSTIDLKVNVLRLPKEDELIDVNTEIEEETNRQLIESYRPHRIVKQETLSLDLLTYDEACLKMEKSHDAFMLFRNEEDYSINVIHRRLDGEYGVIVIETEAELEEV